jgi:cation:H+ antiporter
MSPGPGIPLFVLSFAATLAAAEFCAQRLDELGVRLGIPEALLGFLTALASDAPELTSAVVAVVKGANDIGLGVVLGSNVFNLAAMIGLSGLLVGSVTVKREVLAVEGAVALAIAVLMAALVLRWLSVGAAAALMTAVLALYLLLLARGPAALRHLRLPFSRRFDERLLAELEEAYRPGYRSGHGQAPEPAAAPTTASVWRPVLLIVPGVAVIIGGATAMVDIALSLADRWNVPHVIVGVLVLSVLTSLPDTYMAIRLAYARRGLAVVSTTLHSNAINVYGGVMLPALVLTLAPATGIVRFDIYWLIAMTSVVLLLLARRGVGRREGALLVGLYAIFVGVQTAFG